MPDNMNLLMLVGAATAPGRLAAAVAAAAEMARTAAADVSVEVLNVAEAAVETCDGRALADYGAATRRAVARVVAARGLVVAAPVYRASYPGVLKNLFDILPVEALQGKPVGIVSMGGSPHHYLAVDSQLRPVLAWFGALAMPTAVYLTGGDFQDGRLTGEGARRDLAALCAAVVAVMRRLDPASLGPPPLAARFT